MMILKRKASRNNALFAVAKIVKNTGNKRDTFKILWKWKYSFSRAVLPFSPLH
ncbi:hypothetical protein HMPREF1989_00625 [Porphyromonas gingivalis F0566]|nr:hypothetical protein HMPREF1989_00625 [Porphyromonas gingivalis F0566]